MEEQNNQPVNNAVGQQPAEVPNQQSPTALPSQPAPIATPPQQPGQPVVPGQYAAPATTGEDPGKTLGIISLVTSLLGISLVGLITGIIGKNKSKKAGYSNGLALAGIIISSIGLVIGIALIGMLVFGTTKVVQKCQQLGPGTHYDNGVTYTCN